MKLRNIEMENMLSQLEPLLEMKGKVGYAAARNTRLLRENNQEYQRLKHDLISQYGEPEHDEHGEETGQISITSTSPNFGKFASELTPLADMEHEVDIFTVPMNEAVDILTGQQLLNLWWMFEEVDDA